jgi:very-short-patch-repair endonuclease
VIRTQDGVISIGQLLAAGLTRRSVAVWEGNGRLHRLRRGVYVLGHRALTDRGRCWDALLYGGAGSALSHETAAWAWGLLDTLPPIIDVTTPRRAAASPGLRIHTSRHDDRSTCNGFPVTPLPRTFLDCAATLHPQRLAAIIREADYRRRLDAPAALAICTRGRDGSAALKRALEHHLPEHARANGELEARFLQLCRRAGLPAPQVNVRVAGVLVDVFWPEHRLVVELDGVAAHATPAGLHRDRDRDLRLRAAGVRVVRYTWRQVTGEPERVIADLRRLA